MNQMLGSGLIKSFGSGTECLLRAFAVLRFGGLTNFLHNSPQCGTL